jgi:carbon-monoxide dehydrogenase medium subunit
VKPPPFAYHAPSTVEEALELLGSDEDVRILAGGQSLVQLLKFRRCKPDALVDINGIAGLDTIEERDGELHVGALVRQQTLLEDQLVAERWPLLREAVSFVGYKETRRRGTLAGSLAFAAPWAELTAAAVALDAQIDIRSGAGERSVAAREFFRGGGETMLERGELIVRVRFPAPAAGTGAGFDEVSIRHRDYAVVAAAAQARSDGSAELVLLCVAATPHRICVESDDALDEQLAGIEPADDVEASADYRRRVAPVLARRALARARARVAA